LHPCCEGATYESFGDIKAIPLAQKGISAIYIIEQTHGLQHLQSLQNMGILSLSQGNTIQSSAYQISM